MENNKLSDEQINQIINLLDSNGIKVDLHNADEDWTTQLSTNKFGYLSTIMNYRLWLENGSILIKLNIIHFSIMLNLIMI